MDNPVTNVTAFPRYQLTNVPNALRQLAAQIESGELPVTHVVLAIEHNQDGQSNTTYRVFGEDLTPSHAAGILEASKLMVLGY